MWSTQSSQTIQCTLIDVVSARMVDTLLTIPHLYCGSTVRVRTCDKYTDTHPNFIECMVELPSKPDFIRQGDQSIDLRSHGIGS